MPEGGLLAIITVHGEWVYVSAVWWETLVMHKSNAVATNMHHPFLTYVSGIGLRPVCNMTQGCKHYVTLSLRNVQQFETSILVLLCIVTSTNIKVVQCKVGPCIVL